MKKIVIEKLKNGEDVIHRGKGNSMTPLIKSGQRVLLTPCTWEEAEIGDAVFCKVRGMITTHLVIRYQIITDTLMVGLKLYMERL
jgi:hypothetical protein